MYVKSKSKHWQQYPSRAAGVSGADIAINLLFETEDYFVCNRLFLVGGHSLKLMMGILGHWDPLFSTHSHLVTLILNNSQPIFDNLSQNDFSEKLSIFCNSTAKNVSKFMFCVENWPQNRLILCLVFSLNYHLFWRKLLTERPLVLSCCFGIPVTSKVDCLSPIPDSIQIRSVWNASNAWVGCLVQMLLVYTHSGGLLRAPYFQGPKLTFLGTRQSDG